MSQQGHSKTTDFWPDVKYNKAPVIVGSIGFEYYVCQDGKLFIPEIYDKVWSQPKTKMLPKNTK